MEEMEDREQLEPGGVTVEDAKLAHCMSWRGSGATWCRPALLN